MSFVKGCKLKVDQEAQEMIFVLEKEKLEIERKKSRHSA